MNIIFTHHAQERMQSRKMARSDIEKTLSGPEQTFPGKKPETIKFIRHIQGRRHEVVAKMLKDQNAWLVLSVWVRGEEDHNWITAIFSNSWKLIKWMVNIVVHIFRK